MLNKFYMHNFILYFLVGNQVDRVQVGDHVVAVVPINHKFDMTSGICCIEECFLGS